MAIKERQIVITYLYDDNVFTDLMVGQMTPEAVLYEMNEGSMIGSIKTLAPGTIPANRVREELLAIGNDGTFFDEVS